MTFIPTSLQPVPQILWQPVVVGQLHNETIEQLKRENDLLKQQLDLVLSVCNFLFRANYHRDLITNQLVSPRTIPKGVSPIRPIDIK